MPPNQKWSYAFIIIGIWSNNFIRRGKLRKKYVLWIITVRSMVEMPLLQSSFYQVSTGNLLLPVHCRWKSCLFHGFILHSICLINQTHHNPFHHGLLFSSNPARNWQALKMLPPVVWGHRFLLSVTLMKVLHFAWLLSLSLPTCLYIVIAFAAVTSG